MFSCPRVGFLVGRYTEGLTAVEAPDQCMNVADVQKACCKILQTYIENSRKSKKQKHNNQKYHLFILFICFYLFLYCMFSTSNL
jgi:hypothetical protein